MSEEIDNHRESSGRRVYDDPNAALNRHIEENDLKLRRFFIGVIISCSIIGLATTVALVGFGIVLYEQQKTSDRLTKIVIQQQVTTNQLSTVTKQNKQTAQDIQTQRKNSVRTSCEETNARYIAARDALINGVIANQKDSTQRTTKKEIQRQLAVPIAILKALQPYRDCAKAVSDAVKPTPGG